MKVSFESVSRSCLASSGRLDGYGIRLTIVEGVMSTFFFIWAFDLIPEADALFKSITIDYGSLADLLVFIIRLR